VLVFLWDQESKKKRLFVCVKAVVLVVCTTFDGQATNPNPTEKKGGKERERLQRGRERRGKAIS
jgi:hypothetical protein